MIEMVELNVRCVVLSVRVLWECSSSSICRDSCRKALKQLLGARYAEFETLSAVEKHLRCSVGKTGRTTVSRLCCI